MPRQNSNADTLLFIMRHGEAESLRVDDKSRQLTEFGRAQVSVTANWLIDKYCEDRQVDLALVSPYRRARQTFDMLSLDLSAGKSESCDDVVPEGNPAMAHDYVDTLLNAHSGRGHQINRMLLVSHMPFVSYFLDEVCTIPTHSLFATASVAVVRYNIHKQKGELVAHFQG